MWALVLLVLGVAHAETADEVIAKARAANQVSSSIQKLRMTATKGSVTQTREVELKTRREGDVVKTYMRFTAPSDYAGMAFQQIDNPGKADEMLVWRPAEHRTSRISGAARNGTFFGDFTYEDLEFRSAAEGAHTLTDAPDAWVVETKPTDSAAYSKIVATISKADLIAHKVQFYDNKTGALVKELEVTKTGKEGARNVVLETTMKNVQKNTSTKIEVLSQKFDVSKEELPDDTFTPAYLEKG
jgi:hypothetical protein